MTSMSHPDLCRDPIFILGILMRTGTNFLYDLVRLHLDCDVPTPVPEDYLVHCADLLAEYVGSVAANWRPHWGVEVHQNILLKPNPTRGLYTVGRLKAK